MEKKHQQEEYVDFVVTARKYKTLLTAKYKSRPMWHKPSAGDVVSHLPGTIIKIMVEEGQAVEAGQLLLKCRTGWSLPYRESLSSSM